MNHTICLTIIFIAFIKTNVCKQLSETATITPDESSAYLSITLNNDYASVQDNTWKIWTPERQSYDELVPPANSETYATESDDYKASQTGMNLAIQVGKKYSFSKNQISTITITIDGTFEGEYIQSNGNTLTEGDMILAFTNTSSTQYFSSLIRLDNNCFYNNNHELICAGTLVYPKCEQHFAMGDIETISDGSDFRYYTVTCPDQQCEELNAIENNFPIIIQITNDPRNGQSTYKYINYNQQSVNCLYNTAFEVNNGFKFYIAGEGINAPEILYISSITVAKEYCDNRPEWISRFVNNGKFILTDPCYEGTNFQFIFESMTLYLSSTDTEGMVTLFQNVNGGWMNAGVYDGMDSYVMNDNIGINARINKYIYNKFECEMVIFMEEGKINEQDVVSGTLKFTMRIDNIFDDIGVDENNDVWLKICVDITANGIIEETTAEWQDATLFTLANGVFKLQNEKTAKCISNDETVVNTITVSSETNGNVLCYIFSACDGVILYDPFVYYEGEEEPSEDGVKQYNFISMLLVLFVVFSV